MSALRWRGVKRREEQEVEAIISVCESLRMALCDVTGSVCSVSAAENQHSDWHVLPSGLCEDHDVLSFVLLLHSHQAPVWHVSAAETKTVEILWYSFSMQRSFRGSLEADVVTFTAVVSKHRNSY